MNNHTKIKVTKVSLTAAACGFAGLFFHLQEIIYFELTPSSLDYNINISLLAQLTGGVFAGLVLGFIEIFFLRDFFRKKSFGFSILTESLFFITVFFIITIIVSFLYNSLTTGKSFLHDDVIMGVLNYFAGYGVYLNLLNWSVVFALILFVLQISDKFGHGILFKFITGRYHAPKEEQRIFLFLDLNSSTEIGEKLGHLEYHSLLNDFFSDCTYPIINNGGEIYQYVGDEISASWLIKNPEINSNVFECYLSINEVITKRKEYYKLNYNLVPKYKAGIHCGKVTAGEVGIIKKEIVFTGDVLNTTHRIMNSCDKYEIPILFSQDIKDISKFDSGYEISKVDEVKLRGKIKEMPLYTLFKKR